MATVTASYNWVSGETVTPTKLNTTAAPTVVVADNEVTTSKILDGAVTNVKLATGIDASKLTTGTLPIARIADGAITASKLDGAQTGSAPIYGCRAWVNFDGTRDTTGSVSLTNTNRLIRGSGNVSSVSRSGVGIYTINFTTAMGGANYCVTATVKGASSVASESTQISSTSASSCEIYVHFDGIGGSAYTSQDAVIVCVAIFE
jgi:hypothetical protein